MEEWGGFTMEQFISLAYDLPHTMMLFLLKPVDRPQPHLNMTMNLTSLNSKLSSKQHGRVRRFNSLRFSFESVVDPTNGRLDVS